ncbi:MAG: hypothetical protein J6Y00_02795 [Paludibacteraceae bacterium]|nr:hypothetical protein [Paludibacteraceae bacterium]
MKWSKDILTYLLFVAFAFLIWWTNAWNDRQSEQESGQQVHKTGDLQEDSRQMITEKLFELPIEVTGVPQGKIVRVFPSKAEVYVRVRMNRYEELQKEDFRVWCSYPVTQTDVLMLHVDANETQSLSIRVEPEEVEYLIEDSQ